MKAVVLRKPKQLELAEIPVPALTSPEHVLIKVEACGICGSDLRYWAGENPWAMHTLGRHIDNPPNMVLGHELAGEVVQVNSPEYEHLLGKRVGVQSFRTCGVCQFCRSGRQNLCRDMIHIGHAQGWGDREFFPGAYAEYCLGWGDLLHPMSEDLSYAEAAMADIYCVAMHVVGRTRLYEGAGVLCVGGGPAGLSIAQIAEYRGAKTIVLSEPSPTAKRVIESFGNFAVIDPTKTSLTSGAKAANTSGFYAAIYDSVGTSETMTEALGLLEESGTYVNLAVHDVHIDLGVMSLGSERTITTSSNAFYQDLTDVFDLLNSRAIDSRPLITHHLPLEKFSEAFDLLLSTPKGGFKVVFEPHAG